MTPMTARTNPLPEIASEAAPEEILRTGVVAAEGPTALACSFSVEDVVVIDMLQRIASPASVFAIDTGRLNEETYEVAESLTERYGITIEWFFPQREAVEHLIRDKGPFSFRESLENRHECCHIRKVEPLGRALAGRGGWITGMRRQQSVTRAGLAPIEIDEVNGGLLKINPLLEWDEKQVWKYARDRRLPINHLHQQGYSSIGCAPCTRAIQEGEHPRAGRWWWENPEQKECGLHRR